MTTLLHRSSHLPRISSPCSQWCRCRVLYAIKPVAISTTKIVAARRRSYATKDSDRRGDAAGNAARRQLISSLGWKSKPARGFESLYTNPGPLSPRRTDARGNILHSSRFDRARQGKPARGFERLYDPSGPLSLPTPTSNGPSNVKKSRLTQEEEEGLDRLLITIRKGLPASQVKILEESFQAMRSEGIPPEIREILDSLKGGAPLDLATAAKLVRTTSKMMRDMMDKKSAPDSQASFGSKGTKTRPSSSEGQKQKNKGAEGSFKEFTANIDASTFLTAAFVGYLLYRMVIPGENTKDITWQEVKTTFLDKGLVEKFTVQNGSRVKVDLHREATARIYPESPAQHSNFRYSFSIGSVEAFEKNLEQAQNDLDIPSPERIPVSYRKETNVLLTFVLELAPTLLLIGGFYWLSRRAAGSGSGGGLLGIGKSKAKKFNHETDIQVRFKDVAGMDEAKAEIMEFVSFLKEPGQYQRLGAKIPRGALLSGPPGTGKTLLAKATAGESQVPFFSISGSEFVEIFVGVGASRVRDLFQNARKNTPCIIFIDEIDAVGKARGKSGFSSGGNDEREGTLNQILTEMDGFNTAEQVVVLAGTNRPDVLDKALLRPGRFDRQIAIDRPTMEGRKQIFKVHLGKIVTSENMENLAGRLASLTPGFSGADIANCVNEAALIGKCHRSAFYQLQSADHWKAARTSADKVALTHFEQAIERVIGGLEKKSLVLNPEEKRTVSYHEAGHAICGWYFKYADPLLKVSIIPRGQGALGYAQYLPQGDTYLMNVNQLMDRMAMTLAGRVSEELHFDTVTSGASDDFNKVTRMATAMVTQWGMSSKIGTLYFAEDQQQLHKPFSEETARSIDQEVRRIVDEAYKQCRDLLTEKKTEIGLVAEELLRKEVLGRDDLVRLLGRRPFEDNKEFSKYFDGGKSAPPPPPTELPTPEGPGGAVAVR